MRYYAIPDLHGRFDLLKQSVQAIADDVTTHDFDYEIITLGDYIDRGPDSKQIIEYLMTAPDHYKCLKGNHEAMMVETIRTPLDPDWWMGNGGDATMASYGCKVKISPWYGKPPRGYDPHHIPPETVDWVDSLPLYYETDKQVFVHAGVSPDVDLDAQHEEYLVWHLYTQRDSGGWHGKHVVHGHHIHDDGPHTWHGTDGGRTALDTGSYYTGRHIIGVFDDTQGPPIKILEVTDDEYRASRGKRGETITWEDILS